MIFTEKKKEIRVMFTPFRDGLQSVFGGKTRLKVILPAIEASAAAGIRHFEFGGGARFQAPFFMWARIRSSAWRRFANCRAGRRPANSNPLGLRRHPDHPAHLHPRFRPS